MKIKLADIVGTMVAEIGPTTLAEAGGAATAVATATDGRVIAVGDVNDPFVETDGYVDVDGFSMALYADWDSYIDGADALDIWSTGNTSIDGLVRMLSAVRPIQ